jgi:hypothetical protein
MEHRSKLVPLAIMGSLSAAIMVVFMVMVMHWFARCMPAIKIGNVAARGRRRNGVRCACGSGRSLPLKRRHCCIDQSVDIELSGASKLQNPDRDKFDNRRGSSRSQPGTCLPESPIHRITTLIFTQVESPASLVENLEPNERPRSQLRRILDIANWNFAALLTARTSKVGAAAVMAARGAATPATRLAAVVVTPGASRGGRLLQASFLWLTFASSTEGAGGAFS